MAYLFIIFLITILIGNVRVQLFDTQITNPDDNYDIVQHNIINFEYYKHYELVQEFYRKRRNWRTSNLGTLLFKIPESNVISGLSKKRRTIVIFIWNKLSILLTEEDMYLYGPNSNFLNGCSVKNCIFTRRRSDIGKADAVLVNIYKDELPVIKYRDSKKIWVLYNFESPMHLFDSNRGRLRKMSKYVNLFNWTMTYRTDADVPIPYGRVIPLVNPIILDSLNPHSSLFQLVPYWSYKRHDILIATLVLNCKLRRRMHFLSHLRKAIGVDVYGNCYRDSQLSTRCPGYIHSDCPIFSKYLFYLVLETARCQQYVSDKIFFFAYSKGAIPIIWGIPLEDCEKLLPPDSFLHVDHYSSYTYLVEHVKRISKNQEDLLHYHKWRKHYRVTNEHGYYGTKGMQFCRLCEALNYNSYRPKNYNEEQLGMFLDPFETCW